MAPVATTASAKVDWSLRDSATTIARLLKDHLFCMSTACIGRPGLDPVAEPFYLSKDAAFIHVLKHTGSVTVGNRLFRVRPYDAIYIPPLTRFQHIIPFPDAILVNFHFSLFVKRTHLGNRTPIDHVYYFRRPFSIEHDGTARQLLHQLQRLLRANTYRNVALAAPIAHRLVIHYYLTKQPEGFIGATQDGQLNKITELMVDYEKGPLSVALLANMTHLSPRQLERRIKRAIGLTPRQFISKLQYNRIFHELTVWDHNHRLTTLADKYGFEYYSSFCRWFKKTTGLTPRQAFNAFCLSRDP